ncbi:uncharacterized protein B0P05DRAFT_537764 [Gilbertella persicaria]|uniref:uncharacterized protein n=1 Tax=Gilbertella persicaria TaxID=101096 RepID=UPI00221F01A7|nr:uncharacterized protein B0P05DRAFT_537764 [Gilbertella persicaria]KAI8082625.1 hypothetical protein B0P05DRAFT_537764 [Gilbertella persicaria]
MDSTKEEPVQPTLEEDTTSEEQGTEAQKTLDALEAIPEVMEKLADDNTQYDLHVQLIDLLKKAGLQDELEQARMNMHDIYPMSEALWLDWIQDTKKEANTVEGKTKLFQLHSLAQEDYVSITIWKDYVDFVLEDFYQGFTDDITTLDETVEDYIDNIRQDLLTAVRATSSHVKQSQMVWKPYSEFELSILERFKQDEDQLRRVKKMYLDRLAVLHIDCEDTFQAYSSFVTQYHNQEYEASMVEANKIYAKIKKAAEERDYYELQLTSTGYALDAFYQYIDYELTTKNMFALNHVRSLYERAIVYYCTDPSLWDDYILFLIERARIQAYLETTCTRAVRNCPWSGILWAHLARTYESGNKSTDQIQNIFDRALASKPVLSSIEDLVTVLLAKCDYARRKIDWEDLDEEAIIDLKVAFEESLEYVTEAFPDSGDPYYRIEKYYAFISLKRFGDVEKARELWEDVVDRHGLDTEAWIQFIQFERDQGNYERCTSLFKQAIQKKIDNPARLMDIWSTIEHEIGTLGSYEEALVRINRKQKILSRQWQSQYVKEEDTQEKKIMDREKEECASNCSKTKSKREKAK